MSVVYVVHPKSNSKWTFSTEDEAVEFIGQRESVDPEGVNRGDYQIDDMSKTFD